MKFQANDHQALKEIADEIIMFEGIQHPNLIRYYGVEVHRVSYRLLLWDFFDCDKL
jgi:mitogen-activated protein kinase kinase kinase 4